MVHRRKPHEVKGDLIHIRCLSSPAIIHAICTKAQHNISFQELNANFLQGCIMLYS